LTTLDYTFFFPYLNRDTDFPESLCGFELCSYYLTPEEGSKW